MFSATNTQAKQRVYRISESDRLQISLSNGYDPVVVESWLRLCPLEVLVAENNETEFALIVNCPPGISVCVLPRSESSKPYYANTDDDIYSRLQLPRRKGFSVKLSVCSDVRDAGLLKNEPIVIKPFRDEHMIVAATKVWQINRGAKSDCMVPSDPHQVPAVLAQLIEITEQQIPDNSEDIVYFRRRLNNILDIFNWYNKSIVANTVREFLAFNISKLNDLILKCQEKERALKRIPEWNSVFFDELFKKLSTLVDCQLLENAKKQAIEIADNTVKLHETTPAKRSPQSGEVDLMSMVDKFANPDLPGTLTVKSVLSVIDQHIIPLHQCNKCHSSARYVKGTRPDKFGRPVEIWHVACTGCNAKLNRDKWHSSEYFVGFLWNKDNEGEFPINEAPGFNFNGLSFKELSKALKDFNNVLNHVALKTRESYKNINGLDINRAEAKLFAANAWASYIALCIKQINLKHNGKTSEL